MKQTGLTCFFMSGKRAGVSRLALAASLIWIPLVGVSAPAQTSEQVSEAGVAVATTPVVPQQVRYSGKLASRSGDTVEAVFNIYAAPEGGEPLWTETQHVAVDADGSYSVLLGSATTTGLPQTLFAGGAARWLGISVERAQELPRVLLSSVPYAMKSADAQALAGHPAGDFVTQEQLSQFAQTEAQRTATKEFQPLTNGTITGSGTTGTIAQFTGANTIGNSLITQTGSMIGIGETTPVATLDVNGGGQFRGTLLIPAKGTATTSTSQPSQDLEFAASGWSTTTAGPVTPTFYFYNGVLGNNTANPQGEIQLGYQLGSTHTDVLSITGTGPLYAYGGFIAQTTTLATTSAASNSPPVQMNGYAYSTKTSGQVFENFAWQVIPTGNDTMTPSANLNLLYGTGSTSPTGLSISSKGIINWATGQTFPGTGAGTITGITTSSPLTGSGTSGSVALGLNETTLASDITPGLETTFNTIYPQLATSNTFTSGASFGGPITASASGSGAAVTATGTSGAYGVSATSDTGNAGSFGNAAAPDATIYSDNTASYNGSYIPVALNATATGTGSIGAYADGTLAGVTGSSSGLGVWGVSGPLDALPTITSSGVLGNSVTPAFGNAGVLGFTGNTQSTSFAYEVGRFGMAGMWGDTTGNPASDLDFSAGVIGTTDALDGYGGVFIANSADSDALFAKNLNSGAGIYAESLGVGVNSNGQGTGGTGVDGFSPSPAEGQAGIFGNVYQLSGTYGTFETTGPVGFVAGVWGDSGEVNDGTLTYTAGVVGTGDDITAGVFENNSSEHPTINVVNLSSGGTGLSLFKTFMATSSDGVCGFGGAGNLTCTGQIKSLATTGQAHKVETYAVQSPENWMEDFGSGELKNGVAVINVDPAFAETVTADGSYHVFITPNGDSEALYVINKTANSFEVRESKGGTSSLTFDYRIVGKRRGYEAQRLVDVTERFNTEQARAMPLANAVASRRTKTVRPSMTSPGMPLAPGGQTAPHKASTTHMAPLRIGAGRTPVPQRTMNKPANTPVKH